MFGSAVCAIEVLTVLDLGTPLEVRTMGRYHQTSSVLVELRDSTGSLQVALAPEMIRADGRDEPTVCANPEYLRLSP